MSTVFSRSGRTMSNIVILTLVTYLVVLGLPADTVAGRVMVFQTIRPNPAQDAQVNKIRNYEENQDYNGIAITEDEGGDLPYTSSTQHVPEFNPSFWTPLIIVLLFISVIGVIGAPTLLFKLSLKRIQDHRQEQKRKFTSTLPPLDAGFVKIEQYQDVTVEEDERQRPL